MHMYAEKALQRGVGETPRIIAPDRDVVFAERARRFHELADGHALSDWLQSLGRLSEAQHAALGKLRTVPLPDAATMARAHAHGMPPAPAQEWQPDGVWRAALRTIVAAVAAEAPETSLKSLARLADAAPERLDALAVRVLRAELGGDDAALLPFVAAALQVVWTALADALGSAGIRPLDASGVCPCCGSLPVASVVRGAGDIANLRYLHCSLCNTEWNMVRVKCAACDGNEGIAYRQIAGTDLSSASAVRAETCDDCMSYLKIVYREKAPHADPVADDLATLALDVLVGEAGYARAGPNLLFVPGG